MRFRLGRERVPTAVALVSGVLVIGGCGASGKPSSGPLSASKLASAGIRFSSCMRSHGVAKFPDPSTSGGGIHFSIRFGSGINLASPSFRAAEKACGKLIPGGAPGSGKPSAAAKAQILAISECMRAHGVAGFPDPTTTPPGSPAGYGVVIGYNGVFLAVPSTIDMRSPAVKQAAIACHFAAPEPGG